MLGEEQKKKKEPEQQGNKAPESSKAFNRITKVGLALYVLIIALILTINLTEKTDDINEITNLIFVLSPLLFTKFLKEWYEYLITLEDYNNSSKSEEEKDIENKSVTFLLSAMAIFPVGMYVFLKAIGNIDIFWFVVFFVVLGLVALFINFVLFPIISHKNKNTIKPKDNDKNDSKEKPKENKDTNKSS